MDKNTIFVKTKEGEEAVRQRTRLVQRNLRNILIMVDGHASVADLSRRFGDEGAAQAALGELLSGGFIEELNDLPDFDATLPPDDLGENVEDLPVLTRQLAPSPSPQAESEASSAPAPPVIEEIDLPAHEYESRPPPQPAASSGHREAQQAATGPGWGERIKALLARREKDGAMAPVDLEPIGRGSRGLPWPQLVLFAAVGIAVLLGLTLQFYPYGRHLPAIEQGASAMLRDPVKVGSIGFSFMPHPHLALHDVKVGQEAYLTVGTIRATPDFLSLLGETKIVRELAFDRVGVKGPGLGRLAQAGQGTSPAGVEIRHILLTNVSLTIGDILLGGIGGEVVMGGKGMPEKVLLHNADGTFKVEALPKGGGYQIAASGSNWKAPFKPGLVLQTVDMKALLQDTSLQMSKIEGKAFDGLMEGKASLDWAGGASLAGNLELKHVNSTKLLAALGTDLSTEGVLSARLEFAAKADKLAKLADALRTEATFEMKRGALKGFDLGEAVRRTGNASTRGGETKFEQLTGTLQCDPQDCRVGNVRLSSGLFRASGNLGIAGNAKVSGNADVELKSSATTLRMPLTISGTTKDPLLTPGRSR